MSYSLPNTPTPLSKICLHSHRIPGISQFALQNLLQNGVVNAGKKLAHINLQDISKLPRMLLAAVAGAMRTFADAVGIAVGDETALKNRLDNIAQSMMYDAITKRGGADQAAVWDRECKN